MSAFETALATVEDGLVAAIPAAVADAMKEADDVFALALTYSFEGPPLPPVLGLLTESEYDALTDALASDEDDDEADPWDAWNPAEYELFDIPELEFELSADADEASDDVNDSADENERAVVAMLNRVARRLNAHSWPTDLVVFATDFDGADVWTNLDSALSPEQLAALRAAGRLSTV